jgi:hypothetical protein
MLIIGENIDTVYLNELIAKSQKLIKRIMQYTLLTPSEYIKLVATLKKDELLLLWKRTK